MGSAYEARGRPPSRSSDWRGTTRSQPDPRRGGPTERSSEVLQPICPSRLDQHVLALRPDHVTADRASRGAADDRARRHVESTAVARTAHDRTVELAAGE